MTHKPHHFDREAFRAKRSTPAKAAKPAKAGPSQAEDSQLSQLSQAQLAELDELVAELADERAWLADRGLLVHGDGNAIEFRAHFARLRDEQGLMAALADARRHWAAAIECKVLSLSDPRAEPRVPRPVGTGGDALTPDVQTETFPPQRQDSA